MFQYSSVVKTIDHQMKTMMDYIIHYLAVVIS